MRTHALPLLGLVALLASAGCNKVTVEEGEVPDLEPFAKSFQANFSMYGMSLASGPQGDILVGGIYSESTDLGGGALHADVASGQAVFIAHLDKDGNHLFSGSTGYNDTLTAAAIGPEGDLYVAGSYDGAINFGTGKLTGYKNGYLAAFQPGGASDFSMALGGEAEDWLDDIAVSPAGNIVVAARAGDDADFGGGPVVDAYSDKDGVVAMYDREGGFLWEVRIPGAVGMPLSVASDEAGNVVVAGRTYGDVQVGSLTAGAGSFIAKISAAGMPLWVQSTSSDSTWPELYDVAVGPDGSVYVAGAYYYGSFSIAGLPAEEAFDSETFWLRLSPEGKGLHLHQLHSVNYYAPPQLAVAPNGEVVVGLTTYYPVDFGDGTLLGTGTDQNAVLARFTPEGGYLRGLELEGTDREYVTDLAIDPNGNTVVLGWFTEQITIGGETLAFENGPPIFVARLDF